MRIFFAGDGRRDADDRLQYKVPSPLDDGTVPPDNRTAKSERENWNPNCSPAPCRRGRGGSEAGCADWMGGKLLERQSPCVQSHYG